MCWFQIWPQNSKRITFDPFLAKKLSKIGKTFDLAYFRNVFGQKRGQMLSDLNSEGRFGISSLFYIFKDPLCYDFDISKFWQFTTFWQLSMAVRQSAKPFKFRFPHHFGKILRRAMGKTRFPLFLKTFMHFGPPYCTTIAHWSDITQRRAYTEKKKTHRMKLTQLLSFGWLKCDL